jgi:hypothetical protein
VTVSDKWQVVDVTGFCQAFVDSVCESPFNGFSVIPAPYAGLIGGTDMRGFLAGLQPEITYEYFMNPDYTRPAWADEDVFYSGCGDSWFQRSGRSKTVTWDSLALGDLIIKFQYPDKLNERAITYRAVPRGDTITFET